MTRREKLETMLAATPDDLFLRYALAMALASEGDVAGAVTRLEEMLRTTPDYVAAYFQLAQLQAGRGNGEAAKPVLTRGIEVARRAGDAHAEGEMRGFLEQLP